MESCAWLNRLNVLSSKIIGILLSDITFRISVALRYGCNICVPQDCVCDEAVVKADGIHGLSCRLSASRFGRHLYFNKIPKLSLTSAQILARLEPIGLNSGNKERPTCVDIIY